MLWAATAAAAAALAVQNQKGMESIGAIDRKHGMAECGFVEAWAGAGPCRVTVLDTSTGTSSAAEGIGGEARG